MNKWIAVAVILAAGIGFAAFLKARSGPAALSAKSDLSRDTAAIGWPADQTFAWSFRTPKDDSKPYELSLRIRTKTSTLTEGDTPVSQWQSSAMPATEAETEFGPGMSMRPGGQNGSGRVTVQLLDLREIAAVSATPGQDLRLLANMSIGGAGIELPTDRIVLPAGHFVGHSMQSEGTWTNDELYLMSFDVQNDRKLMRYDVLLKKSAERPAQ